MGNLHFSGPLLGHAGRGNRAAAGGLVGGLPLELMGRRHSFVEFIDFDRQDDHDGTIWTNTDIGVPTAATVDLVEDTPLGELLVNAGTAATTGIQSQLTGAGAGGEVFAFNDDEFDGRTFAFEFRVKMTDVALGTGVVGMMETDTTAVSTAGAVTVDNGFYFRLVDGGTLAASVERATNVTSVTATLPATVTDTWISLGMRGFSTDVSSATATQWVEVYVNGLYIQTLVDTTNGVVPNVGLCPTVACVNDAAGPTDLTVDYFWAAATR